VGAVRLRAAAKFEMKEQKGNFTSHDQIMKTRTLATLRRTIVGIDEKTQKLFL
jgi:hypothetical protein